jgi:hypothetical protein
LLCGDGIKYDYEENGAVIQRENMQQAAEVMDQTEKHAAGSRGHGPNGKICNRQKSSCTKRENMQQAAEVMDQTGKPAAGSRDHGPNRKTCSRQQRSWTKRETRVYSQLKVGNI